MPQAPEFWDRPGLIPNLLRPFGWAYRAIDTQRRRRIQPQRVGVPVICVGNFVAGGAGKTPVVLSLAQFLQKAGRRPHILSRGYGGNLPGPLQVDPARHGAGDVGDEPLLLATVAPTWIGRDRIASAKAAIASGADFLLLDDGFQNPALHYDISLVVVDGGYGIGNGEIIPAGPLREPVAQALSRATAIVMVGKNLHGFAAGGVPMLGAQLVPVGGDDLKGTRVVAFAGIGRPEKFFATLRELGATLVGQRSFPDHHRYADSDIVDLAAMARVNSATLVTTEKDWVRLSPALRSKIRGLKVELHWDEPVALARLIAPTLERSRG
jgi:tetraacyldisaccharide 4'-kinase